MAGRSPKPKLIKLSTRMKIIEKLKKKWGVGIWGFFAIMTAFSLAGTTSVFLRKKNKFLTRRLAIYCKHTDFFPNLPDTSTYLRNCCGKVPFFLGKREENAVFSSTPFYSQKGPKNITCPVKWLINQRPKMYGAKFC